MKRRKRRTLNSNTNDMNTSRYNEFCSTDEEIDDTSMRKPHILLLGAGASRAALPNGDKRGTPVPLLRDVAASLKLEDLFPDDLRAVAQDDFESAYSQLYDRVGTTGIIETIDAKVAAYFRTT